MMEKYQANNVNRDMFYEEQKRDKIKAAQEEVRKDEEEKKKLMEEKDVSEEYPIEEESDKEVEDVEDIKEGPQSEPSPDGDIPVSDSESEESVKMKKGSEVSEDIKDSLESDDPWMQRKNEE